MDKKIQSALISVFHKDGLENIIRQLHQLGITIYSTGGTQQFIEKIGVPCKTVESLTGYPGILGGRVKTLHPKIFGGILARRENKDDLTQLVEYNIPPIDLVIVDLYPFEETLKTTNEEQQIIEKIDIGGVSLIRAAGKNYKDVVTIASKQEYSFLEKILTQQNGSTSLEDRKKLAAAAFAHCAHYDVTIAGYFNKGTSGYFQLSVSPEQILRYGENPHQQGIYFGNLDTILHKLHGKELSYNNLVDVEAACRLIQEFDTTTFAIIKHTNACGIASRPLLKEAWEAALEGDSESAFGGVLICNAVVDEATAIGINEIFFEILIARDFDKKALDILKSKKNRILIKQLKPLSLSNTYKNILDGILTQDTDQGNYVEWKEVARPCSEAEKEDLIFANLICKHLKSNAIALVKNKQLIGKGCGQTSRVDALKQAIAKSHQFHFDLSGAVMASDAFFPFRDCVEIAHEAGITAVVQPGGSIRDNDSIEYCREHNMAMVLTGMRHFLH